MLKHNYIGDIRQEYEFIINMYLEKKQFGDGGLWVRI